MKNTIAIFTFALGVASVFAASPLSFKAVKPGTLVTNEPSFAPTPKEVNDAFGKSFGEILLIIVKEINRSVKTVL